MNKKIRSVIMIALLAILCLGVFVSCGNSKISLFDYSESELGLIGNLVRLMHGWIGNYGWTVVVFTVFLKIVMLPLDFWQRYSSRKNSLKMQKMQPLLEAIDKRYGANTPRSNEEKQKLYKKQGTGMFGMCLPMILSMVIFFVMFGGLNSYSRYSSVQTFKVLSLEYYQSLGNEIVNSGNEEIASLYNSVYQEKYESYLKAEQEKLGENKNGKINYAVVELYARAQANTAVGDKAADKNFANREEFLRIIEKAQDLALENVTEFYSDEEGRNCPLCNGEKRSVGDENADCELCLGKGTIKVKEGWLWIQNVWQPDTWAPIMPGYNDSNNGFANTVDTSGFPGDRNDGQDTYYQIRNAVLATGTRGTDGNWNGLMILPILSIALSFLSMFLTQLLEKKNRKGEVVQNQQQAATNKVMMIVMPLMMAFFGFMYTGAFAIYMVVNYTLSIISTVALRFPVEKMVEKNLAKIEEKEHTGKASYMR